jgi:nitroreductase
MTDSGINEATSRGESSVTSLLESRYSTRAFIDEEVPEALVRKLLLGAGKSPSGGNLQPWKVYALTGRVKVELIEARR